jgi:uncharacterized protein involved in outer membrane biogenesis
MVSSNDMESIPALPVAVKPVHRVIIKAAWVGLTAVIVFIAALLLVPEFIDLGMFKGTYLPLVEETLHRRIDVGEVRLSLIPTPSIRLSKLKISDSPAFPQETFFAAEQLQLRLKLWPLLRKRFEVKEFVLEKPVINLFKHADGSFNYSDLAGKKAPSIERNEYRKKPAAAKSAEPAMLPLVLPTRMRIHDGQLNLESDGQKAVRINGIELSLQEFSGSRPFPYRAAFNYPGLKSVSLEGELSYQEEQASLLLRNNRLKVDDLNFPFDGSIDNLAAVPRVNLTFRGDLVEAKAIFRVLSVFALAPHETDISGPMGLYMTISGPSNNLVTQIRGLFKNVKVSGKRAVKGNLNGEVYLRLPLGTGAVSRRLQGNGKLVANDGELTDADLIKRIQRVAGMIGLTKEQGREATTFKNLEVDFTVANGSADFKRIYMINPQMEARGAGTMTLDRPNLNIAVETTLSPEASARATRGKAMTFFQDNQGHVVVPLKITGPVQKPSVNLDTEKLAEKGMTRSLGKNFGDFFKRFFRR